MEIENNWTELKKQYNREAIHYGSVQIDETNHLIREDSKDELAQSSSRHQFSFQDMAMQEFIQMGYVPEEISYKMIVSRSMEIQASSDTSQHHEYCEEEFIDLPPPSTNLNTT